MAQIAIFTVNPARLTIETSSAFQLVQMGHERDPATARTHGHVDVGSGVFMVLSETDVHATSEPLDPSQISIQPLTKDGGGPIKPGFMTDAEFQDARTFLDTKSADHEAALR